MPYGLTAFQVNTWLQKDEYYLNTYYALGLNLHVIHQNKQTNKKKESSTLIIIQAMSLEVAYYLYLKIMSHKGWANAQ